MSPKNSSPENQGYRLNQELSDEIRFKLDHRPPSRPFPKKALLLFLPLGIMPLVGVPFIIVMAVTPILLFILAIGQMQREGDALEIRCPQCQSTMTKTWHANAEYFTCPGCRVYALGRDGS